MAIIYVLSLLLLLLILIPSFSSLGDGDDGWGWIPDLPSMNASSFEDVAYLLAQMSANAYRFPSSLPIHGWSPSSSIPPLAPSSGGVHAILYLEEEGGDLNIGIGAGKRMVVAYRGTQIGSSIDCLADLCADAMLWEEVAWSDLPAECVGNFSFETLDYFSQAVGFARRVLSAYPGRPLLLTGHSLGAGLALLVSAALMSPAPVPVIVFSAPGARRPLQTRSLRLQASELGMAINIGHQWDWIIRKQWDGQVGLLCLYQRPESSDCKACFADPDASNGLPSGPCYMCFLQTHILKTLLKVIKEGDKPKCDPAPAPGSTALLQMLPPNPCLGELNQGDRRWGIGLTIV